MVSTGVERERGLRSERSVCLLDEGLALDRSDGDGVDGGEGDADGRGHFDVCDFGDWCR